MRDFNSIEYLENGNPAQQEVYQAIKQSGIMEALKEFNPVLAGTYPLGIQTEGSDLDIICSFSDPGHFKEINANHLSKLDYQCVEKEIRGEHSVIYRYHHLNYDWEIFGQAVPIKEQFAVQHLMIEYRILEDHGFDFKTKIIDLKTRGFSTEEAFAELLGLEGDPYLALLNYSTQNS